MVYAVDAFLCDEHSRQPCSIRISAAHASDSGCFYCNVSFAPLLVEDERVFADSDEDAVSLAFKFLRLLALGLHVEDKDGNTVVI
jgi:hypothetical protein